MTMLVISNEMRDLSLLLFSKEVTKDSTIIIFQLYVLRITILQNLHETHKFFGDRSDQKRGISPRQVRQARKGHPTLGLKEI